jgi:hypothetical protein
MSADKDALCTLSSPKLLVDLRVTQFVEAVGIAQSKASASSS